MPRVTRPYLLIALVLGITITLTALFGALYLYRFSGNLRAQFAKQAVLSAQIFAESITPGVQVDQLRKIVQTFVQGDVLYAQVVRGAQIVMENRAETALGLDLTVERSENYPTVHEARLRDGTPYLDVLHPFISESSTGSTLEADYVRLGFSLQEMQGTLNRETLTVVGLGFGIILVVGLLGAAYWLFFARSKLMATSQDFSATISSTVRSMGLTHEAIRAGLLQIDPTRKEVQLREDRVDLSPKEYELIRLLASEPGRVFSQREILQAIWPEGHAATAKDVKQYIYLLRKKLELDPEHPQFIVTVRGFGYKLTPDE